MIGTYREHKWQAHLPATAIGGLPVSVAAIAWPRPAGSCFSDLRSRNPNRLRLISCRLARTRAYARPRGRSPFEPLRRSGRRGECGDRCFSDPDSRSSQSVARDLFLRRAHARETWLRHLLDGRASFPARRHGIDPEPLDDGDASVRRHQEPEHRLRLQHRADVASAAPRRGLRDGRHPDRRAGDLRRRARLPHPRSRDLRRRR